MENIWYLVLSLFLVAFVFMWVRERNRATRNLLSYQKEHSDLEQARRNLESLAASNLEAAVSLEIPVLVDCMLHGQFKGFAAKVTIDRCGGLRAPHKIDDRVIFRCERDCILGTPQWEPLKKPLKYGIGYWADDFIVLNMLGAPYLMKRDDLAELEVQKLTT
ncbi:MAG: hypothetical protein WAW13_02785 [Minisyncoccia bacterium]